MRKTKIVCTIGPACDDKKILLKMIAAGMNVARFNMSHGTHEEQKVRFDLVKDAIKESGKTVAILLDTKGPEIRVGSFKEGSVMLTDGQEFSFYKAKTDGDEKGAHISYTKLIDFFANDPKAIGRTILLNDGKIAMQVKTVTTSEIVCTVTKGGKLSNRKSINIPGYKINMPYVSSNDRADIEFGLSQGADAVAASFVRSAEDVLSLRDYIDSIGYENV
ncbi:MAG: pyruvate kinase, partial [Oscillospiraceae bacterium]|nr:pyruvate kinase [Oscillospiraceae bacterium]